MPAISYYVTTDPGYYARVLAGRSAHIVARFELNACQDLGGRYTNCRDLQDGAPDEIQMRLCMAPDEPCQLAGAWVPFRGRASFPLEVDWLGAREFWLAVEFRDGSGTMLPAIKDFYVETDPETQVMATVEIEGILDDRTPVAMLPPPVQTLVAPTRAAYPVTGTVIIENGSCCVGGIAGETIEVSASFEASSPFADVTEMRTTPGCWAEEAEARLADLPWEPFEVEKSFKVGIAINWIGFYVSVQYRDAQGNLSQVYCDDISVEGMPVTLTPAP